MKGWLIGKPASIDDLTWGEVPDPRAGEGQLVVKVMSTALNPVDYQLIESGNPNWVYPHITGVDLAGKLLKLARIRLVLKQVTG